MTQTILQKIFEKKRERVDAQKQIVPLDVLREKALISRNTAVRHQLRHSLQENDAINIIAEIKRASPSKGIINADIDVAAVAKAYEQGGACAISVLTEEDHFKGTLEDLRIVRSSVNLPILRKDFIFDEYQIYEAAEAGANVILLIAAMLDDKDLKSLYQLAEDELGLDALVEVHTLEELKRVEWLGTKLIGVNNRDLNSFAVSLDVSRELIKHAPKDAIMIAESGLKKAEEIQELHDLGFSGFLIGETLMRSGDPASMLGVLQ